MSILVDRIGHLISTTSLDELHTFALRMGLRRSWFQEHPTHPHYDCTTPRAINRAIAYGATLVEPREIVGALRNAPYLVSRRATPPHLSATDIWMGKLFICISLCIEGWERMDIATLRWELVKLNKEYVSLVTRRNAARDMSTRAMLDQKLEWVDKRMEHVTSMLGAVSVDGVCNV